MANTPIAIAVILVLLIALLKENFFLMADASALFFDLNLIPILVTATAGFTTELLL